jgi:trans-aconitate methyltransferase
VWSKGRLLLTYARRRLRPPERVLFDRYREELAGRVLELGCGGGRLTGHLIPLADSVTGIDVASSMIAYCRKAYPDATFQQRDLREFAAHDESSWDAVVAGFNVLDVLDHRERQLVLDGLHRLLEPGGMLIMSSHNLACAPLIRAPLLNLSPNPVRTANRLARLPRAVRNHRRLASRQFVDGYYGILNDVAHDYSLLHYYISREGQEAQLAEHGFELLECLDLDGATVPRGQSAYGCHELHYVARAR